MNEHSIYFFPNGNKSLPYGYLRMRVQWGDNKLAHVNLGYPVDYDKWSKDSQRAKANTTHGKKHIPAATINAEIQRYEQAAEDAFLRFNVKKTEPTEDEYRSELRSYLGRNEEVVDSPLVYVAFNYFIQKESALRSWSKSTCTLCREVQQSLLSFDPDLKVGDFDEKRFEDFFFWMAKVKGYANRTIRQRLLSTKSFFRWAKEAGYQVPEGVIGFRPRLKVMPKTVIWLTWEELQTLMAYRESPSLSEPWRDVLDCFLLSCFTGLRLSDIINLRWADIGKKHIRVVTKKTSAPLYIDLNDYSRTIVEWHRDDPKCKEFVLPRIDRLNSSITIKRVCRDAGIVDKVTTVSYKCGGEREEVVEEKYKKLSMHSGRRTFICNALALGISPLTVMKWTGHKDYASMKPYIDISDADKEIAMTKFNK